MEGQVELMEALAGELFEKKREDFVHLVGYNSIYGKEGRGDAVRRVRSGRGT
jgi:hypothetical protein